MCHRFVTRALLADERCGDVAVASRSGAEIEYAQTVDAHRERSSTAIELLTDLLWDALDNRLDARVHLREAT